LATLLAALLTVALVVPGGQPCAPGREGSAEFEQRVSERRWLRKWLHESEVRMHFGEPERVDAYGLLSFWRYPGPRTVIFDSSGRVIGWENF
jgi:hypothetical protein